MFTAAGITNKKTQQQNWNTEIFLVRFSVLKKRFISPVRGEQLYLIGNLLGDFCWLCLCFCWELKYKNKTKSVMIFGSFCLLLFESFNRREKKSLNFN